MQGIEYENWSVKDFEKYSTHVIKILGGPSCFTSRGSQEELSDGYMALSPKYTIPPEIIEFITTQVFVKRNANVLHVGIRIPKFIGLRFMYWFLDICLHVKLKGINFTDWILFITENRYPIRGYFYVNCNPNSIYYGQIMVICNYRNVNTGPYIKYGCVSDMVADLLRWFKHCELVDEHGLVAHTPVRDLTISSFVVYTCC